jgi:hypothetical protein
MLLTGGAHSTPDTWSRTMYDDEIDDRDAAPILTALRRWAEGHPARDQPFMAIMGDDKDSRCPTLFTPLEFLDEVERKTDFGRAFMHFVLSQARRYDLQPEEFVFRAVEANRFRSIGEEAP